MLGSVDLTVFERSNLHRILRLAWLAAPLALVVSSLFFHPEEADSLAFQKAALYRGFIKGKPSSPVTVEVRNDRVEFVGRANVACTDGRHHRWGFTVKTDSRGNGRFRQVEYQEAEDGSDFYERLKGRIVDSQVARGWFSLVSDRFFADDPDCSTGGRLRWRAERVR
jgi:hypothetical protein